LPSPYLSRLKLEKELEKKAKALREKKEKCDKLMEVIDSYFSILEGKLDLEGYKKKYEEGKNYYDMKDMDAAISAFDTLKNELAEKVKGIYEEESRAIDSLIGSISGESIAKIRASLKEGEELLDTEPQKSFEILESVKATVGEVVEEQVGHVARELKEVIGKIEGMEWVAEEAEQVGDTNDSATLERLLDLRGRAIDAIRAKIEEDIEKVHKIVEIAASAHFNLPVDKSYESKIKELLESENYAGAMRTAREYMAGAKKSFDYFYKKLFDIAKRIAEEGKAMGIDVTEPLNYLEESKAKYDEDDIEGAVELIRKSTGVAEKQKFQKVMDEIKKAREIFLEAKEQGIDITPYLKKIDNARNFLKIGKHKRAYDIVLETIDMVKRRKDLYNQLADEINRIKGEIADLEKENIILEGVDESVKKIEDELDRDAERAEGLLNDLKTEIKISMRDIAQSLYSETEKMVEAGENEGIVLEDIRMALNDVKTQIGDEAYKDAIISLRKIEEDVYARVEEYLKEIESKTSKYKDKRISESIAKARALLASGDLDGVLKEIGSIREITFEIEGNEYKKKIQKMREYVEFLKNAGGNVTEVLGYLERAEVSLKKKDIVRAEDFISRANDTIKELENLVAKDTFDSAKIIAAAAKRIGVNISKQGIMALLKKAKESIEKEDYRSAIQYSVEAKQLSKDLRDKAEKAYSQLVNAAKLVAKLKDMGANVSVVAKLLVEAKKKFEENDFNEAERLSVKCINRANAMENKAKIEFVRKELDEIGRVMRELGLDKEFKRKSKEFYVKYEDMSYEGLYEEGESLISELREHVETILTDYIGKIETDIYDAKGKGYDLNINMADLENAKDLFIKRRYLDALNILKKLESQIGAVYERNEKMTAIRAKIKKYMDMGMSLGIDVSNYKKELEELATLSNMNEAESRANEIVTEIERALYKKVSTLIIKVGKELDKMRKRGEDVTAPENMLNKAKASLKEKDYVEALNRAMSAVGEIERYEIQKNTAYGILKRLEVKIAAMQNILPKDIITDYEYSKKLFLKGLYEKSIERSMRVSDKISEIERMINYIKEKNTQIRDMVMKAHRLGMDVTSVLSIFNQAKEEFKRMNYRESLKLVDKCYTEAKLLMIDAVNRYKGAYSKMVTLLKRIGLEDEFKEDTREIDRLFEEGDYDTVKVKLSELKKAMDKRLAEVSEDILNDFLNKMQLFKDMDVDLGIDFGKEYVELTKLKSQSYSKFFEYASTLKSKIDDYMPELIKKKIESLKTTLDTYEKQGVNIDEYHSKLYDILSMMEEKDYEEIFKLLQEVESNLNRYLDEYVKTLRDKVLKRLGEYSEDVAREYADRIEKMRLVKNYVEAIRIYNESNDFIAKYKVFMEEFGKKLEEVKDRLRFALSLGLKVGDLISKLKEIEENAPLDMERAQLDLEDLKSNLNTRIDSLEPRLKVSVDVVGKSEDNKYTAKLIVENIGSADAQNVQIQIRGAYKSESPVELLKIDKGMRDEQDIYLEAGRGEVLNLFVSYSRFDGKEYTESMNVPVKKLEEEEKKGYHIEKAKEKVKCAFCRGTILPGMDMVVCDNCGATYHVPCAKRVKKCKVCGQEFKFD